MVKLSRQSFDRAREFLMTCGRRLERALFLHLFESGSREDCLTALAEHQTSSGGFREMKGAIESSPIGAIVAFQHLVDLEATADHPLVRGGVEYFLHAFDHEHEFWPPREKLPDPITNHLPDRWGNPSAEIVGYLWKYRELVPESFLEYATELALRNLRRIPAPIFEFADICFLRLADHIDPSYDHDEIIRKVGDGVMGNLQLDHAKWDTGYFVKPFYYALSPDAPLYPMVRAEVQACLDWEVRTQEEDESFKLTWNAKGGWGFPAPTIRRQLRFSRCGVRYSHSTPGISWPKMPRFRVRGRDSEGSP
jgi:hypothetical protein